MSERVYIFDTTLRDGEQSPGASMNLGEKIKLALQLERLGVDIIEAGFPIASEGEFEAVRAVAKKVKRATVCALSRTRLQDIDRAWRAVEEAKKPRIHTFIASSDIHMKYKLRMDRKEVLNETERAVRHALKYTPDVEFSPEDATRSDRDFLCQVIRVAIEAGATTINVPDTVGYIIPDEFRHLWEHIFERVPPREGVIFSTHCHNDLGLAVANSLAAVEAGVRQVECTVNGIGERAGNASLEEVVMALRTRKDFLPYATGVNPREIYRTSRLLSSITGMMVQPNKAIVGRNAFAHEAGIHQHGVIQKALTYEIMTPQAVGWPSNIFILGKHSGRHGLRKRYEDLGYTPTDAELSRLYPKVMALADKKKEVFDEDLLALLEEERQQLEERYQLSFLQVVSSSGGVATATVKLKEGKKEILDSASADGPVAATFNTLGRITGIPAKLMDYSVNAVTRGKDAMGEVHVTLDLGDRTVLGKSFSTDILEASAKAYLNALNKYMAWKKERKKKPSAKS